MWKRVLANIAFVLLWLRNVLTPGNSSTLADQVKQNQKEIEKMSTDIELLQQAAATATKVVEEVQTKLTELNAEIDILKQGNLNEEGRAALQTIVDRLAEVDALIPDLEPPVEPPVEPPPETPV